MRMSIQDAAKFMWAIIMHCYYLENRLAQGIGTRAELLYHREQYRQAERAFVNVYKSKNNNKSFSLENNEL